MRAGLEAQRCLRQRPFVVAADRRDADGVVLAPPERDRSAHVLELEAPRAREVGELASEPEAAVRETTRRARRAYAASVAGSPVGGGGRLPHASRARAATRGATRAVRIARCTSRARSRLPAAGGIEPTSATLVTRSGATAASASACGPPADQPITANRSGSSTRSRSSPQTRSEPRRTAGPHRSTASSRTPSSAAIASSGCRESRESPPPCR